jgi:flagellar assembly protein FliH
MSSSPSRAPIPAAVPRANKPQSDAAPFTYQEVPPGGLGRLSSAGFSTGPKSEANAGSQNEGLEREARARELGRQQGINEASKKFDEQLLRERTAIVAALSGFAQERTAYYKRIEQEAVQLSLSIARKILHREAQVDPLLLMGVVRVALDKIDGASEVKLAVHPQRAADWRRQLASYRDGEKPLEIVEDPSLPLEQCELRTSMGKAPLGIEIQLKEIEQGLMDLLAARPQVEP